MTDLDKVIAGATSIEHILVEQFGGTGPGMKKALGSVRQPIPAPLQERILHLADLRDRAVHEQAAALPDGDDYQRACAAVCAELRQLHAAVHGAPPQPAVQQAPARRDRHAVKIGAVVLALVAGWAAWHFKPSTVSDTASVRPPPAPAAAGKGTATPPPDKRAAQPMAAGAPHVGIGNDVLALESIEFGYHKGSSEALEPRMMVTVRNSSDRTIASARLDGRLYIGGAAGPVIDTGTGSSFSTKPLYLFFRDDGLAPGARQTVAVSVSGDDRWSLPDVVNASRRTLVLRVSEVTDSSKHAFGEGPRAWPATAADAGAGAGGAILRPASPTTDEHDVRQRFFGGEHVVLSDSRMTIDDLELSLRDDGAGSGKPSIRARFTNRSGTTLGSAAFRVQLFIQGERTPAVDSKEAAGADHVRVVFGAPGLADGASVKQDFGASHGGNWDAPEVVNAIRNGTAQLVVRLESISDSRNKTTPSAAIPIPAL